MPNYRNHDRNGNNNRSNSRIVDVHAWISIEDRQALKELADYLEVRGVRSDKGDFSGLIAKFARDWRAGFWLHAPYRMDRATQAAEADVVQ